MQRILLTAWVGFLVFVLAGCGRLRFIVDAVPAVDGLVETIVLADAGRDRRGRWPEKIAMIDVKGTIADANRGGLISTGDNPVALFAERLEFAAGDTDVRAVIVRINSPGGTVTASDVMYRELMYFKEKTHKPVVVLMADVAASGGYYLACAGDTIMAHPTTITGSIGVIIQTVNVADGLSRIGIRADAITSGSNKSMGSPFAPMSDEHRALLQGIVDEFYAGFRDIVTSSRPKLDESDLEWVTDGRVITGRRAAEIGIVDSVGDLRDAFAEAKRRAGLKTARLVKYHRPVDYVGSAYAAAPAPAVQVNLDLPGLGETVGFYYLWDPTVW